MAARYGAMRAIKRAFGTSSGAKATAGGRFKVEGELAQLQRGETPAVGDHARVSLAFSLQDARAFARLTGDSNPIHSDESEGRPVVQGLLSASLFATIFGRSVPGAVYVAQELRWRAPLRVDERVTASVTVVRVRRRFVDCETVCAKASDGSVVVDGRATVLLPKKEEEEEEEEEAE